MRKTLIAVVLLPVLAWAQSSFQTIGYQGLLKKSDGTPETQTVQVTFRIYDVVTGGTALWSEVQDVTPNSGGFYAVFLGSTSTEKAQELVNAFDGSDRYLELQIQGDSTALTPRQQIGSVPYALTAKNVVGGTVNSTSVTVNGPVTASGGVKGLPAPTGSSDAARKDMGGATLNNLGTPSAPGDAATKGYVDGTTDGMASFVTRAGWARPVGFLRRMPNGLVMASFSVRADTGATTVIGTLPSGYRPVSFWVTAVAVTSIGAGGNALGVQISTMGEVMLASEPTVGCVYHINVVFQG